MSGSPDRDQLERLNSLTPEALLEELLICCGSTAWARNMTEMTPFRSSDDLQEKATRAWDGVTTEDWLEAFRAHPKIGEKKAETERARSTAWSAQEQSNTRSATADQQARLLEANHSYYDKFGFIFIICATGKDTATILASLEERLNNDRATELKNAAAEQAKITALRLEKLLTA